MSSPPTHARSTRARRSRTRQPRLHPGRVVLAAVTGLALIVIVVFVVAFDSAPPSFQSGLPQDALLLANGRPLEQVIAFQGALRIQLPVSQQAVTAIGYHGASEFALPLKPVGRQANEGLFSRVFHRIFGRGGSGVSYYQLGGGTGPSTGALDVGAPAGTDVYAPVDGTVVSVSDFVLNGRRYGSRVDIEPSDAPPLVVSLTRLRIDPSLTVGSPVTTGTSKIGVVLDLARAERQALARVTHDAGNHVSIEVHPAASIGIP